MKTKPIKRILQGIGLLLAFFCFVESAMFFEIVRSNGSSSAYFAHRETIDGELMAFVWKIIFFSNGFFVPFTILLIIFGIWSSGREHDVIYLNKPLVYFGIVLVCLPALFIYIFLLDPIVDLFRNYDGFLMLLSILGLPVLLFGSYIIIQEFKKTRIRIPPDVNVLYKCESCGATHSFEATRLQTHNILSNRNRH